MKNKITLVLTLLLTFSAGAQDINFDATAVLGLFDCSTTGKFYDEGGSTAGYTAGSSGRFILCSTGGVTNPMAVSFVSANFGSNIDFLSIYDGAFATGVLPPANLLYSISSSYMPGVGTVFRTTTSNTSGCLTFQLNAAASSTGGNFEFDMLCKESCKTILSNTPVTDITPLPQFPGYIHSCAPDTVTFTGSGTYDTNTAGYVQHDSLSTFHWDFGSVGYDTGKVVKKVFPPGIHLVKLTVVDSAGCASLNVNSYLSVRQAIEPDLKFTPAEEIACLGDTVEVVPYILTSQGNIIRIGDNGSAGTLIFDTLFAGGLISIVDTLWLPDDSDGTSWNGIGQTSVYEFPVYGYQAGATFTSINDLIGVCLDIEHSYVGDLNITLTCPDGSSTDLVNFTSSNGFFYAFGEPVDIFNEDSTDRGIPYTYCWSPSAAAGNTISTTNQATIAANTVPITPNTNGPTSAINPNITYAPTGNWSNLLGCPMNGNWTITVFDDFGGDNGHLFGASIEFAPQYLANQDTFPIGYYNPMWNSAPQLVSALDSDTIKIWADSHPMPPLTFNFQDSLLCNWSYDYEGITVEQLEVTAAPSDTTICPGASVSLGVTSNNECKYYVRMHDSWGDGWNGHSLDIIVNGVVVNNYTLPSGGLALDSFVIAGGTTFELRLNTGSFTSEVSYELLDEDNNVLFSDGMTGTPAVGSIVHTQTADCSNGFVWTPNHNILGATSKTPIVYPDSTTVYVVSFTSKNNCLYQDSARVTVVGASTSISNDMSLCEGASAQLSATGADTYTWTPSTGLNNPNIANPVVTATSDITYYVNYTTTGCSSTDSVKITILPIPNVEINNGADTAIFCEGTSKILSTPELNGWTYLWSGAQSGTSNSLNAGTAGAYILTYSDGNCTGRDTIELVESPRPVFDHNSYKNIICCEDDSVSIIFSELVKNIAINQMQINDEIITGTNGVTYTSADFNGANLYKVVKVTSAAGCSDTAILRLSKNCLKPDFTHPDTVYFGTAEVFQSSLNADALPGGTTTYSWTTTDASAGAVTDNTVENAEFNGVQEGNYAATLQVTSTVGGTTCTETSAVKNYQVIVVQDPEYPDAFTPNADNRNDLFRPVMSPLAKLEAFKVYNRWGDLMYDITTAENKKGWNGVWNGKLQPSDLYIYYTKIKHPDGKEFIEEGSFMLIR